MKAVIMAGGQGTRLRPLTCNRPKPMVPIMNKPVMEHIINLLKKHNITDIAVTLQYMPQSIQEYFGDGLEFGVKIKYFVEKTPLGTAGSVKNAEDFLDDTFIVISGDALTDIDLTKAIQYHKQKKADVTLVLTEVDVPLEYGVVITDSDGKIVRFLEKPGWSEVFSNTVNTGIYILNPSVFNYIKKDEMFDFSKDLFPILLKDKKPMYGFVSNDYWCDIGDISAYERCHEDILNGKVDVSLNAHEVKDKIWVEDNVEIGEDVKIIPPVFIGKNTKIKNNVNIQAYSIIGSDNIIEQYASLKKVIILNKCTISTKAQLRACILCDKVNLKNDVSIFEKSVIGDNTTIKENVVVKPNIKIWPEKIIESNTQVNTNMVWGTKYSKTLFGKKGISGEINVDITPEFASRLGTAFAAVLKNDVKVAISSDDINACRMLKRSFIGGLMSGGAEVYDFGNQLLPVTRTAVRFYGLDGGIHLGIVDTEERAPKLFLDFLDSSGANITRSKERKLENVFIREDYIRCEMDCVKEVKKIYNFSSYYSKNVINKTINKKLGYNLIVNVFSPLVENTLKNIARDLNCNIRTLKMKTKDIRSGMDLKEFKTVIYMSKKIVSSNSDLGAIISDNGEKMILLDDKGRFLTEDMYLCLIALIIFKRTKDTPVVVPISASNVIDEMSSKYGGKVIRTKTSPLEVMAEMLSKETQSSDLSTQFILNFDALRGLTIIMDFMKENNIKLSEFIDCIPKFHMSKKEVECPWDAKGIVIKKIIEEINDEKVELMEGVKIHKDGGWVLVLPDLEKPVCKIIGEGYSEEFAQSLTDIFANKVEKIRKSLYNN